MIAQTTQRWTLADFVVPPVRDVVDVQAAGGQAVLVDSRSGHTYLLNPSAYLIWQGCDGRTTVSQLARRLVGEYEIDEEEALDHVLQLAAFFAEQDLIGEADPGAP